MSFVRRAAERPRRVLFFAGTHGNWGGASRMLFATLALLDRSRIEPIVALTKKGPAWEILSGMGVVGEIWGALTENRSAGHYVRGVDAPGVDRQAASPRSIKTGHSVSAKSLGFFQTSNILPASQS